MDAARHAGWRHALLPRALAARITRWSGRSFRRTQPLFWEHEGNRAVRSGNWKLVSTYPGDWELYDLAADRVERNNLAARRPDLVKGLAARWNAWAERAGVDPWPGPRRLPWGDDAPASGRGRGGK